MGWGWKNRSCRVGDRRSTMEAVMIEVAFQFLRSALQPAEQPLDQRPMGAVR